MLHMCIDIWQACCVVAMCCVLRVVLARARIYTKRARPASSCLASVRVKVPKYSSPKHISRGDAADACFSSLLVYIHPGRVGARGSFVGGAIKLQVGSDVGCIEQKRWPGGCPIVPI